MSLLIKNVSKFFREKNERIKALDNVSFELAAGSFTALLGPTGCGKTTLARIICGIEDPSEGEAIINGKPAFRGNPDAGLVFQDYALLPWKTVKQNIELGLKIKGAGKAESRKACAELIERFGLSGFEHSYPSEISGGMRQRTAIARSLILKPGLLVMDEPFSSLDVQTRADLQEFVLGHCAEQGRTTLFITHNVEEAIFLSERVIVMSKRPGRIVSDFAVDLPYPRERTGTEFNSLRAKIEKCIRDEFGL